MTAEWILRYLGGIGKTIAVQQIGFLSELIEFAASLDQLRRRVKLRHAALVQDHDSIGIDDGVDAVRNRNDSAILEGATTQCALEECVCLHIHSGLLFFFC